MKSEKQTIEQIEKTILELTKVKERLSFENSLIGIVTKRGAGTWVINSTGSYYQFSHYDGKLLNVHLMRHNKSSVCYINDFETAYRLATPTEVQQHEAFLKTKGLPKMGETTKFVFGLKNEFKESYHLDLLRSLFNGNPTTMFDENSSTHQKIKDARIESWFEKITLPTPISSTQTKNLIDPQECEFYMVTCRGNYGSKIRHNDYDDAVKEAKKWASQENHPTWVVGVVKKINPWD